MPNWKKVIVSGSDATLKSVTIQSSTGVTTFTANADTLIFSGSAYFTGSTVITGSLSATSITASLNNLQGTPTHIPFFSSSQVLADSVMYQVSESSIAINQNGVTSAAPEALYVWQPSTTSYNVISGKGNLDNYLQLNIQNTNQGTSASSDVVATANNGNESTNYVDMGINSEFFTGSIGKGNDAYLYSTGHYLHVGNASNYSLRLFAGGADTDLYKKLELNPNNFHELTGSLNVSGSINAFSFTGSLLGTASYADNTNSSSYALTASYAPGSGTSVSSSYTTTASYALNADLLDGKDSTIFATTGSNTFKANQTISGSNAELLLTGGGSYGTINFHSFNASIFDYVGAYHLRLQANNQISVKTNNFTVLDSNDVVRVNITGSSIQLSGSVGALNGFTGSLQGTASYALTASYLSGYVSPFPYTGSALITGSLGVTGSVSISGSTTIIGTTNFSNASTTITGSFLVSGSTTQIGNNTLTGDTTLSGSIIISGSQGQPNPTISIFGDLNQTGYTRYLPVTNNLDTSISASYVFVSGSTQDLYFSQNSKGYNNVTRLRWLEGNLYTGLLNGGLITTSSSTVYNISSGSGIIVNLNASLNDNPYPTIQYLNWNNLSQSIAPLSASYDQAFVGIQSNGTIFQQGTPFSDGQFDTLINIGVVLFQNNSTINGVKTQPSVAYGFEQAQNTFNRAFGPLKLSGYTVAVSGSSTGSIVVGSGTAYSPGSNYAVDPNNPYYSTDPGTNTSKFFRYYQSGSGANPFVYLTNAGNGYPNLDPVNYNNNGTLTTVGAGNYSIQRLFWYPNSVTKAVVAYYGNAIYGTMSEGIANLNIEPFTEAPNTAANAIYLGAYVIKGGTNTTLQNPAHYTWIPGGLFRSVGGSGGGGSIVTQTLSGLSDVSISGQTDGQPLAWSATAGKWINSTYISASVVGNASSATSASYAATSSWVLNAINANTASYVALAQTASFVTTAQTASYVTLAQTSSYVNRLSQNVIITGSLAVGTSSILANENTITLGARDAANEGGQIGFNAPGGTYTSASFIDNWSNYIRILRGTNATSTGLVAQWNLGNLQMELPAYTSVSSFTGTAVANLAVDSSGKVITVSTTGGSVFPYVGNAVITGSLTATTGLISPVNGAMYLRGGDDAELWDINVVNTVGVYGQQDQTVGSIKLGSGGGTISGKTGNIGINTITPTSASLHVSGNVFATSFTGSLFGTASYTTTSSYALIATSASYANNTTSASYALTSTSASYALTATTAATSSYASSLTIGISNITTNTVASSIVGSNNVFTQSTGSFTGAKYIYTVSSGSNARTGEVLAVWNGTSTQYTDVSTLDIGSTTAVTASVSIVTAQAQFNIQTNTSGWKIKSIVTYM